MVHKNSQKKFKLFLENIYKKKRTFENNQHCPFTTIAPNIIKIYLIWSSFIPIKQTNYHFTHMNLPQRAQNHNKNCIFDKSVFVHSKNFTRVLNILHQFTWWVWWYLKWLSWLSETGDVWIFKNYFSKTLNDSSHWVM